MVTFVESSSITFPVINTRIEDQFSFLTNVRFFKNNFIRLTFYIWYIILYMLYVKKQPKKEEKCDDLSSPIIIH